MSALTRTPLAVSNAVRRFHSSPFSAGGEVRFASSWAGTPVEIMLIFCLQEMRCRWLIGASCSTGANGQVAIDSVCVLLQHAWMHDKQFNFPKEKNRGLKYGALMLHTCGYGIRFILSKASSQLLVCRPWLGCAFHHRIGNSFFRSVVAN